MDSKRPFIAVYIEASRPLGVIYIGMTANLYQRSHQHREGAIDGFTKKHRCNMLVWYEEHELVTEAIRREKALKRWNRRWKIEMIERENPGWADLHPFLCGQAPDPRVRPEDECGVAAFLARIAQGDAGES